MQTMGKFYRLKMISDIENGERDNYILVTALIIFLYKKKCESQLIHT